MSLSFFNLFVISFNLLIREVSKGTIDYSKDGKSSANFLRTFGTESLARYRTSPTKFKLEINDLENKLQHSYVNAI